MFIWSYKQGCLTKYFWAKNICSYDKLILAVKSCGEIYKCCLKIRHLKSIIKSITMIYTKNKCPLLWTMPKTRFSLWSTFLSSYSWYYSTSWFWGSTRISSCRIIFLSCPLIMTYATTRKWETKESLVWLQFQKRDIQESYTMSKWIYSFLSSDEELESIYFLTSRNMVSFRGNVLVYVCCGSKRNLSYIWLASYI